MTHFSMRESRKRTFRDVAVGGVLAVTTLFAAVYPFLYPPAKLIPEKEVVVTQVPDFAKYTRVEDKKRAFFGYLIPEIKKQNEIVTQDRLFLLSINAKLESGKNLSESSLRKLEQLMNNYRVKDTETLQQSVEQLLSRVDIIPIELVLAQAANESAWGTSRFAQQGYNFFGLWCFKKGCGFVPSRRTEGSAHEVAKFRDLSHAVMTYIRNLNRHYAYEDLRTIRATLRENQQPLTAEALVHGLMSYSERGQDYIDELLSMISYNRKYMSL